MTASFWWGLIGAVFGGMFGVVATLVLIHRLDRERERLNRDTRTAR